MEKKQREPGIFFAVLGTAFAVYIIGAAGLMYAKERSQATMPSPFSDEPPRIEFNCDPPGEINLKTAKCRLHLVDDTGLDFTTYRMRIEQIDRDFDMPIEGGMIGRDYETPVSFGLIAGNQELITHGKMTVIFSISDTSGHKAELEKSFLLNTWRQTGIRE